MGGRRYNSKAVVYKGIEFRSMFERDSYKGMVRDIKKMSKDATRPSKVLGYECDYLPYTLKQAWYNPDFTLIKTDGGKMFIETKGWFSPSDRRKMRAVKETNPDADIRMVFMKNHLIGKRMRCDGWCKRHGFPYAFEDVPLEWLEEAAL